MYGTIDASSIEESSSIERLEAKTSRILGSWALDQSVNDPEVPLSVRMVQLSETLDRVRKRAEELGW